MRKSSIGGCQCRSGDVSRPELACRNCAEGHCEALRSNELGRLKIGAPLGTIDRFEYGIIHFFGEGSMILNFEPYPFQGVEGKVPLSTSV